MASNGNNKDADGKIHLSVHHTTGQVNIRTEGYPCGKGSGRSSEEAMEKMANGSLDKNSPGGKIK